MSPTTNNILFDIPADWQAILAVGNNKAAKAGEWKNKKFGLDDLVRGLTQHTIGPKDGPCFLQGNATGGHRQARAMEFLYVIGIDVDNGMPSREIDEIVRARGLFAIRYTTHSHGKDYTEVRKDDWVKYLRANEGATIAEYLVARKRYLPEVATQARVESEIMTPQGPILRVGHPAMDKNRLIFVLARPWSVLDYEAQSDALKAWEDAYMSFTAWLGIVVDRSCTDTSRLFYLPRREPDALYEAVVHNGKAIDIFTLPKATPSRVSSGNVFLDAAATMGADDGREEIPRFLKTWAAKNADRFLLYDTLEANAPQYLRPEKDRETIRHIECPFEAQHTKFGGSGTFVVNAGESPGGGFVVKCMHDACVDRDRLGFLAEMIRQEWLPEEALTDPTFLIEVEGDSAEAPIPPPTPTEMIGLSEVKDAASADLFLKALAESDMSPIQATDEINRLVRHMRDELRLHVSRTDLLPIYKRHGKSFKRAQRDAEEAAVAATKATEKVKRETAKEREALKKQQHREKQREEKLSEDKERQSIYVDTDHLKSVRTALGALESRNDKNPYIFRSAGSLARIIYDENDYPRVERMGPDQLTFELSLVTRYLKDVNGNTVEVEPTAAVVRHILANPEPPFPILTGIVTAPVFGRDGQITTTPGYDPSSKLFFEPTGELQIASVPETPTRDDVERAVDLLMGNALIDFPFDGPNDGMSEKAHALCMVLQPFARQLIDGPTPIYLIVKPTPGTGASKLVNIYSLISTGEDAVAQTEARSEDEIRKRITSVLLEAAPTFYLDNINYRIDSGALASAVTASKWTDRLLGQTKTVNVPVRHTWIFAGNNPTMSNEIARRCVRIRLDAKVERPELRTGFKHKDLEKWVRLHRAELIWACLTLIQNWIAHGRPEGDAVKGSFESWSRVMGGILRCAGFEGFLANDGELREDSDEEGNAIRQLITAWWDTYHDKPVSIGGGTDGEGLFNIFEDEEIPLPIPPGSASQQKISFGKYVARLKGRIFSIEDENGDRAQLRMEAAAKRGNKSRWRLVKEAGAA